MPAEDRSDAVGVFLILLVMMVVTGLIASINQAELQKRIEAIEKKLDEKEIHSPVRPEPRQGAD